MSQDYDNDIPYTVFSEKTPVARKSHRCMACWEKITPGSQYEAISGLSDGDFYTTKRCARCVAIYDHLRNLARKAADGTTPDFFLDCGHSYEEVHGQDPPPEIAALAFALPGEVAITVGVSPSYLSDIENDHRVPAEDVVKRICEAVSVDFDEAMSRACRLGESTERYLKRHPDAVALIRRIAQLNFNSAQLAEVVKFVGHPLDRHIGGFE